MNASRPSRPTTMYDAAGIPRNPVGRGVRLDRTGGASARRVVRATSSIGSKRASIHGAISHHRTRRVAVREQQGRRRSSASTSSRTSAACRRRCRRAGRRTSPTAGCRRRRSGIPSRSADRPRRRSTRTACQLRPSMRPPPQARDGRRLASRLRDHRIRPRPCCARRRRHLRRAALSHRPAGRDRDLRRPVDRLPPDAGLGRHHRRRRDAGRVARAVGGRPERLPGAVRRAARRRPAPPHVQGDGPRRRARTRARRRAFTR